MPAQKYPSSTRFLNVDLDMYSKFDLQPIVDAFGRKARTLYVGRDRGRYCAHLEIEKTARTADSTIRAFCELIRTLPKAQRDLWDAANVRSFSVGIRAGKEPNPCDFIIRAETVTAVSELAAQIVLTIYAPERRRKRNSPS